MDEKRFYPYEIEPKQFRFVDLAKTTLTVYDKRPDVMKLDLRLNLAPKDSGGIGEQRAISFDPDFIALIAGHVSGMPDIDFRNPEDRARAEKRIAIASKLTIDGYVQVQINKEVAPSQDDLDTFETHLGQNGYDLDAMRARAESMKTGVVPADEAEQIQDYHLAVLDQIHLRRTVQDLNANGEFVSDLFGVEYDVSTQEERSQRIYNRNFGE